MISHKKISKGCDFYPIREYKAVTEIITPYSTIMDKSLALSHYERHY